MFVGISPEKSNLDDTDISLLSFPSSSYLKLVNAPVTPKIGKGFIHQKTIFCHIIALNLLEMDFCLFNEFTNVKIEDMTMDITVTAH